MDIRLFKEYLKVNQTQSYSSLYFCTLFVCVRIHVGSTEFEFLCFRGKKTILFSTTGENYKHIVLPIFHKTHIFSSAVSSPLACIAWRFKQFEGSSRL